MNFLSCLVVCPPVIVVIVIMNISPDQTECPTNATTIRIQTTTLQHTTGVLISCESAGLWFISAAIIFACSAVQSEFHANYGILAACSANYAQRALV